jgi:hypothetical protein
MRPLRVIEDQIVGQLFSEEPGIMDRLNVVPHELFFYGPVIAFDAAVNLRTTGIGKVKG